MDEKNNKCEDGMVNIDDVKEKYLVEFVKFEVGREKSLCGFDFNEDICFDEIDDIMFVLYFGMFVVVSL